MLDRRAFVTALPLLCLAARSPGPARDLIRRAIARAGGRRALSRARILNWTGKAVVFAGERRIEIGVDTMVEPFVRARSKSWLLAQGPEKSRTLILEPDGAWIERDGQRTPMPAAMRAHEEQQFALYGLMRLIDLEAPGIIRDAQRSTLRVAHPEAPETLLRFDSEARLVAAENSVLSPDGGSLIPQRFGFEGRIPGPIAWPRRITIHQAGRPYFTLELDIFRTS